MSKQLSLLYINAKGELCKESANQTVVLERVIRGVEDQFFNIGFTFSETRHTQNKKK